MCVCGCVCGGLGVFACVCVFVCCVCGVGVWVGVFVWVCVWGGLCVVQRRNARLECSHSLCFLEISHEFKTLEGLTEPQRWNYWLADIFPTLLISVFGCWSSYLSHVIFSAFFQVPVTIYVAMVLTIFAWRNFY